MTWLENNPLGLALAAACGILLLLSSVLIFTWSRPASSGAELTPADAESQALEQRPQTELEPIAAYREFTERPVFDESRRPVVSIDGESLEIVEADTTEVGDQPQVKPTGIVITPEASMVTLRPLSGGKTIIAHEGRPLEGEYVGWIVSDIKPRTITLASLAGDVLQLDLEVNTREIAEPPRLTPMPDPETVVADEGAAGAAGAEGEGQPLSRAEEIRQRIAERREELRRQAEENQAERPANNARATQYNSAIRNMINRNRENEEEQKKDGDNGSDG